MLSDQGRTALQAQQSNLYFQRLNRRTYLLSVLYNIEEAKRVRRESLIEFLQLDRELKLTEMRNDPRRYRINEERLLSDPEAAVDWHRLVTLHPRLRTDLSGVILRGMDMAFLDLSDIVLRNADLSCTNLSHAKLMFADLTQAKFIGADLGGARLNNATCTSADFSGVRLNGAYLNNAWLQDANFNFAYLWKTNFAKYRNQRHPPKSATKAYVGDLYDSDQSRGAKEFELWARENGATTETDYEAWQRDIARDLEAVGVRKPCD